jgi:hypothetical protein
MHSLHMHAYVTHMVCMCARVCFFLFACVLCICGELYICGVHVPRMVVHIHSHMHIECITNSGSACMRKYVPMHDHG